MAARALAIDVLRQTDVWLPRITCLGSIVEGTMKYNYWHTWASIAALNMLQ